MKYFNNHEYYQGEVIEVRPGAIKGKDRRIRYNDSNTEKITHQ